MVAGTGPRPHAGHHDEGADVEARCRSSRWSPRPGWSTGWWRCLGMALVAVALGGAAPSTASPQPGPGVVVAPDAVQASSVTVGRTCEPIRVELCRSAVRGYNMTIMPNLAGHEFQKEAEGHLSTFAPLVQYGCSSQLLLFLCAVLVPMCTDQVDQVEAHAHDQAEVHVVAIGPCRGLCEAVRSRCLPVLLNFSYPWPPHLDCARFPAHNSPAHMCMEGPGEEDDDDDASVRGLVAAGAAEHAVHTASPTLATAALPARCAEALPHFSRADKQMAEVWLSIWSGLCFVSSVLALLTLRLGPGPGTPSPTPRPVVAAQGPSGRSPGARASAGPSPLASLALSYGLLSVGWGTRVLAGRSTSASPLAAAAECDASDLRNPNCAAVFLLTYFFGTASIIWWVVLAAVWFLSAGLRMSPSSLQRHSYLFHLAGWGVPAALTLGVLVLRDVAAEPLTGTCQVGPTWSTVFVLAPQCAFLCCGLLFLALGALTQWRSKPPPAPQALLWPLAVERLGLLAGLCALPLAVLVATHALELGSTASSAASSAPHLTLRLFQVRLVASLVVGVAAPFWVWPGERPWPPCPPWPRPPRAWRYPGVAKGPTSSSTAASCGVGPAAATTAPLLPPPGSASASIASRPPCSALLGPALPGPAPGHCPVPVHGASCAAPARSRGGSSSGRTRSASNKHYRKHHGSETTV